MVLVVSRAAIRTRVALSGCKAGSRLVVEIFEDRGAAIEGGDLGQNV